MASSATMNPSRALGQFFTPPEVVDLAFAVLAWLQPELHRGRLLDLSCGEGAFLQGALRHGFAPGRLYGLDADPRLLTIWLETFPPGRRPHLGLADGLLGPAPQRFDVLVGNPPFAGHPDDAHVAYLTARYGWWRLSHPRNPLGLPRDLWFLERSLGLLRHGGLLAMVLPEGLLANRRWRKQRTDLLARHQLEAVIGLPRSVFRASRAVVKTCLLFVRKQPPQPGHVVRLAELAEADIARPRDILAAWEHGEDVASGTPWEQHGGGRP
jgi:type I restriction-modification system DNA methylase subunit